MGIASGLKKAASRGFIKLGGTVTIKRETTSAYDLQKGQVHKNITTKTVQGAIENVVQREVNDLVTAQDKKLTISADNVAFFKIGVISLKTIPFLGKSSTSLIVLSILSIKLKSK